MQGRRAGELKRVEGRGGESRGGEWSEVDWGGEMERERGFEGSGM